MTGLFEGAKNLAFVVLIMVIFSWQHHYPMGKEVIEK